MNNPGDEKARGTGSPWYGVLRLHDLITDISYVIGALAICAMAALYAYEVVVRYFFNAPTNWGLETVSYLMLVSLFLVMPAVTRARGHITVDIIVDYIGRRTRFLSVLLNFTGFVVCGLVAWFGWNENVRQYVNFIETLGNIPLPKWWISSFITFGFAMTALWFLRLTFRDEVGRPVLRWLRYDEAAL